MGKGNDRDKLNDVGGGRQSGMVPAGFQELIESAEDLKVEF